MYICIYTYISFHVRLSSCYTNEELLKRVQNLNRCVYPKNLSHGIHTHVCECVYMHMRERGRARAFSNDVYVHAYISFRARLEANDIYTRK